VLEGKNGNLRTFEMLAIRKNSNFLVDPDRRPHAEAPPIVSLNCAPWMQNDYRSAATVEGFEYVLAQAIKILNVVSKVRLEAVSSIDLRLNRASKTSLAIGQLTTTHEDKSFRHLTSPPDA